jgi:hypothetical protein
MSKIETNSPARYIAKNEDGSMWVVGDFQHEFFIALISNSSLRIVRVPENEIVTEIPRVGYTVRGRFWTPPMGPFYWAVPPAEAQLTAPNTEQE